MSIRIECSTCGDMIEVTASTVTLPFVCLKCEENMNSFTQAFDADTVKSVVTILKNPAIQEQLANRGLEVDQAEVDKFYEAMKPKSELTDEYASVENTTLLIEDLEKQLADARGAIEIKNESIKNLASVRDTQLLTIQKLGQRIDTLVSCRDTQFDRIIGLKQQLASVRNSSDMELSTLRSKLTGSIEYWRDQYEFMRTRLLQEQNKSFWDHFKEATFDRLP